MIRFSVDLGEVNLEEPARLTGEPVNVGEGKARLNFGERKDFCFLQIMKLIFGAVSQVKGRRNVFLRVKGGSTFYFSLKQTQTTFVGAHGLCGDAARRLSSLVLAAASQFETKTRLNLSEITIGSRMSNNLSSQIGF